MNFQCYNECRNKKNKFYFFLGVRLCKGGNSESVGVFATAMLWCFLLMPVLLFMNLLFVVFYQQSMI
ncbi:hypothetical protein K457DRAFT_651240 [Linnemannia elongata AG-77]|uniref:Uncharacterized protein n=1 Tax=Linnemannia elongata AG-77 TaxID=1314771 RepID=A0A197KDD3_9FUNG|nr:hypothetical protein K457DRAFT_651240 [Linnemannia elongata AG-77]